MEDSVQSYYQFDSIFNLKKHEDLLKCWQGECLVANVSQNKHYLSLPLPRFFRAKIIVAED